MNLADHSLLFETQAPSADTNRDCGMNIWGWTNFVRGTSQNYTASHVLAAMGLSEDRVKGALRFSWCHLTPKVDWPGVVEAIKIMRE